MQSSAAVCVSYLLLPACEPLLSALPRLPSGHGALKMPVEDMLPAYYIVHGKARGEKNAFRPGCCLRRRRILLVVHRWFLCVCLRTPAHAFAPSAMGLLVSPARLRTTPAHGVMPLPSPAFSTTLWFSV